MATITKRGRFQHQVQIRRKGYPVQTATFETRKGAQSWATDIESEMRRGVFVDRSEAERTTLREALLRYEQEVTPEKRSADREVLRIRRLLKHPLASRSLASLRGTDMASFRDERLKQVAANTVRIDLNLLSNLFNVAKKDWSIAVINPVTDIRKPKLPKGRDRRLEGDEETRLLAAANHWRVRAPTLAFCIQIAIETGMRAGEIIALTWQQIDLANCVIRLDLTKNGDGRIVPLTEKAEQLIRALPRPIHGGRVTRFHDSNGLSASFRSVCERAGITGLRFHDLRHEAASRFAPHMPVATLAKVMGWRTLQMAMRYYNPKFDELVAAVRRAA